ncbi:DUF4240 domain-containing protein [Flavobacterium frigoris]|uniref:DUF4240 domain-containing protein n=1 Tax=Flavobacterium frigoris TaxID=229204 RepID=A0A1H9KP97_FLAFI|nr:DUF4240 domain-containing protein [Flavobacterium frigoris]SER00986.1 Protein of unknown function [Flavobacterium frigoris]
MKNSIVLFSLFFSITVFAQNNAQTQEEPLESIENLEITPRINLDSISLPKSSEMLEEEAYWALIENSLKETTNQEDQELFLVSEIEKLTPQEMIGFRLRTDQLLYDSYNPELWCAAYIVSGGCSDGGFEYFRCWLISQGKEVFYRVKSNPDALVNEVVEGRESYEFEGFWYVAMNAFKNSTGEDLYSYIDYDAFVTNDENYPLLKFNWNPDEPATMEKVCPVLFQKLWK